MKSRSKLNSERRYHIPDILHTFFPPKLRLKITFPRCLERHREKHKLRMIACFPSKGTFWWPNCRCGRAYPWHYEGYWLLRRGCPRNTVANQTTADRYPMVPPPVPLVFLFDLEMMPSALWSKHVVLNLSLKDLYFTTRCDIDLQLPNLPSRHRTRGGTTKMHDG